MSIAFTENFLPAASVNEAYQDYLGIVGGVAPYSFALTAGVMPPGLQLNNSGLNQPWFMGFTPEVAIAVTLERVQGGTGGTTAAPIAKRVLEALGQ